METEPTRDYLVRFAIADEGEWADANFSTREAAEAFRAEKLTAGISVQKVCERLL